jgi:hypothetical protein
MPMHPTPYTHPQHARGYAANRTKNFSEHVAIRRLFSVARHPARVGRKTAQSLGLALFAPLKVADDLAATFHAKSQVAGIEIGTASVVFEDAASYMATVGMRDEEQGTVLTV